jgi:hypothetical protein
MFVGRKLRYEAARTYQTLPISYQWYHTALMTRVRPLMSRYVCRLPSASAVDDQDGISQPPSSVRLWDPVNSRFVAVLCPTSKIWTSFWTHLPSRATSQLVTACRVLSLTGAVVVVSADLRFQASGIVCPPTTLFLRPTPLPST